MISVDRLQTLLGAASSSAGDLGALAAAIQQRAPDCIRLRISRSQQSLPFELEPVPWLNEGFWIRSGERPSRSLEYLAGQYYIQDAGSMLAIAACKAAVPSGSARICDLCAAPGGKATALVEILGADGWLLANEPIQNRIPVLEFNLSRTGSDRWLVTGADPEVIADHFSGEFDLVLVDAPCSGQTLVGKQKQSDAAWSDHQIEHSAGRQRRILEAAIRLLRPGGRLVYSTCTFAAAENEEQVDWLEASYRVQRLSVPELVHYEVQGASGCYRLWPHRDRCAGSFAAILELLESPRLQMPSKRGERGGRVPSSKMTWTYGTWGQLQDCQLHQIKQRLIGWPNDLPSHWLGLAVGGPEVAYQTGKSWHPGYPLALRESEHWRVAKELNLASDQAWGVLRGQAIPADASDWFIICSHQNRLCWGKSDGKRIRPAVPPALRAMIN